MSRSRIFHLYGDVTIVGERQQNIGLCSVLLSREGSLSCHTCCDNGASVFLVSSEGLPHSVASYDTRGDVENLFFFYLDHHGSPFSRLLQYAGGCWGPILTRILAGLLSLKRPWFKQCSELISIRFWSEHRAGSLPENRMDRAASVWNYGAVRAVKVRGHASGLGKYGAVRVLKVRVHQGCKFTGPSGSWKYMAMSVANVRDHQNRESTESSGQWKYKTIWVMKVWGHQDHVLSLLFFSVAI
jgi:hypothetical protein